MAKKYWIRTSVQPLLLDSIMNNIAMSTKIEDISLNYLNQSIATVELEKVLPKINFQTLKELEKTLLKLVVVKSKEFQLQELYIEIQNY